MKKAIWLAAISISVSLFFVFAISFHELSYEYSDANQDICRICKILTKFSTPQANTSAILLIIIVSFVKFVKTPKRKLQVFQSNYQTRAPPLPWY